MSISINQTYVFYSTQCIHFCLTRAARKGVDNVLVLLDSRPDEDDGTTHAAPRGHRLGAHGHVPATNGSGPRHLFLPFLSMDLAHVELRERKEWFTDRFTGTSTVAGQLCRLLGPRVSLLVNATRTWRTYTVDQKFSLIIT
jgi:hypothetical protein